MATVKTKPNVSVTFLEREGYHCDLGVTVGGDAKCNTSFRVECGLEGDFLPAPSSSCKLVVCVANTFRLSDGLEEMSFVQLDFRRRFQS